MKLYSPMHIRKIKHIFVFVVVLFLISSFSSSLVFAQEGTDIQSLVAKLQEQIKTLQAQVDELKLQLEAVKTELKFNRTLVRGLQGEDIKQLQEFLKTMPDIYPEGLVTGYFGPLTEAAVKRFQAKQGIESVGFVGPRTIAKLNEVVAAVPAVPVTPATPAIPAVPAEQRAIPAIPAESAQTPVAQFTAPTTTQTVHSTTVSSIETVTPSGLRFVNVPSFSSPATSSPTPSPTSIPTPVPTNLSAPSNLTAVNQNSFRVDLTWSAPSNAAGVMNYRITRVRSNVLPQYIQYNTVTVADVSASSSSSTYSYSDVNVGPDYTFIYKVMSYDGQNYSLPSNDATVTTSFTKTTCLTQSNSSNLSLKGYTTTADGGAYYDTCLSPSIVGAGVNIKQSNCDSSIGAADPILGRAFRISMNYCGYGCSDGACVSSSSTPTPTPTPTSTSTSTPTPTPTVDKAASFVPTNLSASVISPSQINLSWNNGSTGNVEVTGYKIFKDGAQVATSTTTNYSNTGLIASTSYSYRVSAYDSTGYNSYQSASVSATTQSSPSPPPPPPPAPPGALTITSITPYSPSPPNKYLISSIALKWDTAGYGSATYYKVSRRLGDGEWLVLNDEVQGGAFSDLNLGAGTYYYILNTCNAYGCSPDSNIATTTLTMGDSSGSSDTAPPSIPTNLTASNANFSTSVFSVILRWAASTDNVGVAGYNVYRDGVYLASVCCSAYSSVTAYSKIYSYTVSAYDAAGNVSAQSNPLSVTTPVGPVTNTKMNTNTVASNMMQTATINLRAKSLAAIGNILESIKALVDELLKFSR